MKTLPAFQIGQRYRVARDYAFLNHAFRAGEEVIFTASGYSPHEGVTRYWFTSVRSGHSNAWHRFDADEQISDSYDLFEQIVSA